MDSKSVDEVLSKLLNKKKTPSAQYFIFNDHNIIHKFQNGYSDIQNKREVNDNTTYNAYSIIKTMTALAVLQLVENEEIKLEDPVKNHLPSFPFSSDIQVKHLLSHSSGIPNPNPLNWIHTLDKHEDFERRSFFKDIYKKVNSTKTAPNVRFSYSNLGYELLGQLIEKVSGLTFEEYVKINIFDPLKMNQENLGFEISNVDKHAKGYLKKLSLLHILLGFFIDKSKFVLKYEEGWKHFKNHYVNGTSYGGLIGTSVGLVRFVQELLKSNCSLISDKFKELYFKENFLRSNKPSGMCLSWFTGYLCNHEYFAHAGGGAGYYCEIRVYPSISVGSVILFNRAGVTHERFLDKLDRYFIC